tara:strand:- start:2085 stop:2459 length:375 start_codon:yes stop_codon:yes gene_type:complete
MNNQEKILLKIQKSETPVFLRQDFFDCPSSTLSKTLNKLIKKNIIRRVSKGVYVRIRKNRINDKWMFDHNGGKDGLLIEILKRLNIDYDTSQLVFDFLNGDSNQIPANFNIQVHNKTRKINLEI